MFYKIKDYFCKYNRRMRKPIKVYDNPISEECWNLDCNLCQFLASRLEMYANEASKIIDRHDWDLIRKYVKALRIWSDHHILDSYEEEKIAYEKATEAMYWVADNLGSLWW